VQRQYVAIDLHRRRSLILRQNEAGEELGLVRIDNDPVTLAAVRPRPVLTLKSPPCAPRCAKRCPAAGSPACPARLVRAGE
jgi:hypothetical protein